MSCRRKRIAMLGLYLLMDEERKAEKKERMKADNLKRFTVVPPPLPAQGTASVKSNKTTLAGSLLHLLETGVNSDVQFQVGVGEYCFNCHKAIVGGRSEVLAVAMEGRWNDRDSEDKIIIRLPEVNVTAFRVFVKYLYSDQLQAVPEGGGQGDNLDLLLQLMALGHLYQVEGLLKECVVQIQGKISTASCWKIYKESRLIDSGLAEKCFECLISNIHEVAAKNEYLKWDAAIVGRVLSLEESYIRESDLFQALVKWRDSPPADPLEPPRSNMFTDLLPLVRFPSMDVNTFSTKVMKTKVLSASENRRLRRYISNSNPRKRNTTVYSATPRFKDTFTSKFEVYSGNCKASIYDAKEYSSTKAIVALMDCRRAEFSLKPTTSTTISSLKLRSIKKSKVGGPVCPCPCAITIYIYQGNSVLFKEEGTLDAASAMPWHPFTSFTLSTPFTMEPGQLYEFHILYELLETETDSDDDEDEDDDYEYEVTWGSVPPNQTVVTRKVGHGASFEIDAFVEGEEDEDVVDHTETPRWIHSFEFSSKVAIEPNSCNIV